MNTLAERIIWALKEKGAKKIELARFCGVKGASVSDWTNGKTKQLTGMNLLNAAKFLGLRQQWLADGIGPRRPNEPTILGEDHGIYDAPELVKPSEVPIVGHVQAGDDGYLVELEYPTGHGDGVLIHYSKDLNAYAVRVKGDSMRPRIKPGEFIVCEPNRAPYPGDDVVVKLLDGRRMVKEYQWQRDGDICFGSINADHPPIVVSESMIDAIHYVAAIMPRGAFVK